MISVEPIQNFNGFGIGAQQGEYYYSQGMNRTQFGLTPNWLAIDEVTAGSGGGQIVGLGLINWFSATLNTVFGHDANGIVYSAPTSNLAWANSYTPFHQSHGNGLIVDQTGRVLCAGDRYLSKWDGSTAIVNTGNVTANNGNANITGSGTTFTAGMVGKQIAISGTLYTISGFTDATHIALGSNFSGTSGTYPYTIYMGSTEQWKDFGSTSTTTGLRQMVLYQDWVVITNLNNLALLNVNDDSFQSTALPLPSGYNAVSVAAGNNGLLVGVNVNARGAIFLWDAVSNGSISEWIWFNANIQAIVPTNEGYLGYYVITSRGIYLTNGYIVVPLYELMPDDRVNFSRIVGSLTPNSVSLVGNYLFFFGGTGFNRQRQGIYIFNVQTKLFEFCPVLRILLDSDH